MDGVTWERLEQALARRGGATFWWRDDDAAEATPALQRLLSLSRKCGAPLALAVVPDAAQHEVFKLLDDKTLVLQHGCDHRNRALPGEKKTEFPASESDESALERLSSASLHLRKMAGARALPVLVPPWNRIREDLLAKVPSIGIRGVSRDGKAKPLAGLKQVNTHVDIVAWHEGRRFIGEERALSSALRSLEEQDPVGWLTHHAVHDEAAWRFLERLLRTEGVRWASAAELFSYTAPGHG